MKQLIYAVLLIIVLLTVASMFDAHAAGSGEQFLLYYLVGAVAALTFRGVN